MTMANKCHTIPWKDHPDVANIYQSMGNLYHAKGEQNKALEYYKKALSIKVKVFGEDQGFAAFSWNTQKNPHDLDV